MPIVFNKIARSVTGQKMKFEGEFIKNVTFNETIFKLKLFAMKITNNLSGNGLDGAF